MPDEAGLGGTLRIISHRRGSTSARNVVAATYRAKSYMALIVAFTA